MKNNIETIWNAGRLFMGGMLLTALAAAPLGCTEEEDVEGTEEVASKAGALNNSDADKRIRLHRGSTRHEGREGMRQGKHGPKGQKGRRGRKGRDPSGMLFKVALQQDSLTAEQREKIEALAAEKKRAARKDDGRKKGDAHRATLAEAVRNGRIDAAAIKARHEERAALREKRMAARAQSLKTLHATLDASQRQAVVDAIKARSERKGEKLEGPARHGRGDGDDFRGEKQGRREGGRRDHAMGERAPRSRDGRGFRGKERRHGGHRDGIFRLVEGLDLTADQQTRIATLKQEMRVDGQHEDERKSKHEAKREAMKQCRASFLESFAGDSFDPAAAAYRKGTDDNREKKMNQRIARFEALMSILTEEQRNLLANRLADPSARPSGPSAV